MSRVARARGRRVSKWTRSGSGSLEPGSSVLRTWPRRSLLSRRRTSVRLTSPVIRGALSSRRRDLPLRRHAARQPGPARPVTGRDQAVHSVAPCIRDGAVIINKSTVPVGSGNWVRTLLEEGLPRAGGPCVLGREQPGVLARRLGVTTSSTPTALFWAARLGVPTGGEGLRAHLRQSFQPAGRITVPSSSSPTCRPRR